MGIRQPLLNTTALAIFVAGASFTTVAWAQDAAPAQPQADQEKKEESVEKVTVTGSRLKKDEFTSTSPVQIIDPTSPSGRATSIRQPPSSRHPSPPVRRRRPQPSQAPL